jgi:transposase
VLIAGEPGIGKTRRAEQFAESCRREGLRVLWGRCHDGEGTPARWPWVQVVEGAVQADSYHVLRGEQVARKNGSHILPGTTTKGRAERTAAEKEAPMGKRLRLEDKRDQEQSGRPQPAIEVKIAVDLSRSKWVYCVRWEGAEQLRLSTGGEIKHLQALVRRYQGCGVHLAFEACGFDYEIAWWAEEERIAVTVIAPSRMERAPGLQVKTDRLDVGRMARQLEEGSLKGIYIPGRACHERRQVVRTYGQAVKERKRAQVRIRSLMQEHGRIGPAPRAAWKAYCEWLGTQQLTEDVKLCLEALKAMRNLAEHQAEVLEQRLLAMARSQDYRPIVAALCTQRGVGTLSAIRFLLEIGDVRRFPTADSIAHYLGLTPSEYSSGDTVHRGRILKCGPGSLRAAMLQCGWASVRKGGDASLRAVYDRLAPRTGKKRAIIAVTRRLVVRLRALWLEALEEGRAAAA